MWVRYAECTELWMGKNKTNIGPNWSHYHESMQRRVMSRNSAPLITLSYVMLSCTTDLHDNQFPGLKILYSKYLRSTIEPCI